jgi:cytochrome c-type biogenesis protein CcmH
MRAQKSHESCCSLQSHVVKREREMAILMMRKRLNVAFLFLILASLAASPVLAQDDPPGEIVGEVSDDMVNSIAKELYCPVCENIPLDVCPTQACEEWRKDIRDKLFEGWSETQIRQYFVNRYGDRVLATPPARGLNWMIYVIPPIVIAGGAIFLVRTMNHWRRQPSQGVSETNLPSQGGSSGNNTDAYIRELEEELKRH